MAARTSIVNISGDHEETILRLAKHLGTDKIRRSIFNAVYGKVRRNLSKKEIMEIAKLINGQSQQAQNQLDHLQKHHLITKHENNDQVLDGSRFVYGKDESVRANRSEIVKYADKPSSGEKVPTKRNQTQRIVVLKQVFARKTLKTKKKLKILYLSADPTQTIRLDREVRLVQDAVRGSKLRENIEIISLPAATHETLVNGLNDHSPSVVHFSGHGGADGIAFEASSSSKAKTKLISYELLAKAIAATDTPPDVVILCSCEGAGAENSLLPTAKAAIVMTKSISDHAATSFAYSFYAAIASGQSLKSAFAQGTNGILFAALDEGSVPTLHTRNGINAANLVLA
jgi:ribosomal protein L22